jgi:hypothetical protein
VLPTQTTKHPRHLPTGKERRENKIMKYLAIIALAALALSLGACASKESSSSMSASTTASTGYSK